MSHPDETPARLRLSADALIANWRWLGQRSGGAACGAAVKANAYGLGAPGVVGVLQGAGCRDFFAATWAEAEEIAPLLAPDTALSVLHGVREADMAVALRSRARPVLVSAQQVQRWRSAGGGACDVMVDSGINRLGLSAADVASGVLDGLAIDTLLSHLASADEDSPQNPRQLASFRAMADSIPARRRSFANSAGICLGDAYAFDLTRPGLALYGGIPRREAQGHIRQVAFPEAAVLQLRDVAAGNSVGYNATWTAQVDCRIAIINLGYADGYLRCFSSNGTAWHGGVELPVIGRVSMDLVALLVPSNADLHEGDYVAIDYALPETSAVSGLSQYELLTMLGRRYARRFEG
jgi:alanine racemase